MSWMYNACEVESNVADPCLSEHQVKSLMSNRLAGVHLPGALFQQCQGANLLE